MISPGATLTCCGSKCICLMVMMCCEFWAMSEVPRTGISPTSLRNDRTLLCGTGEAVGLDSLACFHCISITWCTGLAATQRLLELLRVLQMSLQQRGCSFDRGLEFCIFGVGN